MRTLSDAENDTAGPCAPSRSVVSYTTIRRAAPGLPGWSLGGFGIKKPPGLVWPGGPATSAECAYVGGPPRLISMVIVVESRLDIGRRLDHELGLRSGCSQQICGPAFVWWSQGRSPAR